MLGWSLFAVWTLLALGSIAQVAIALGQRGQPIIWSSLVPDRLIDWYTCFLFTPVCFWLVRRFPLNEYPLQYALPGYLVVTSACVVLKCLLMVPLERVLGGPNEITFVRTLLQGFLFDLVMLWGVIALLHALEMQRHLAQRERFALALRAQLSEAELEVLRGQLQPHFLFNTLNGVASLIHTAPAAADFVVVQLADLLRASLDGRGMREIPLSEELALLEKYLAIMEARFTGRLTIHRQIDPATKGALVPQFLLQPLVENAFEHGIGRRAGAGRVSIRALLTDGHCLRLEVHDDGMGLSGDAATEGVGLSNTRKRLERLYGDAQSLQLSSLPNGGALVAVEIPFSST